MKDEILEAQYVVFTEMIDEDGFVWHPTLRKGASQADIIGMFSAIETLRNQAKLAGFKPYIKQSGFAKKPVEYIEGRTCPVCNKKLVKGPAGGRIQEKCEDNRWDPVQKRSVGCSYVVWNPST